MPQGSFCVLWCCLSTPDAVIGRAAMSEEYCAVKRNFPLGDDKV